MAYAGGKDGAGVWQRCVNQIPPHDVWVSAFAGDCAVTRHIRPAAVSILIDLDREVLRRWIPRHRPETLLVAADAIVWLRFAFGLDLLPDVSPHCATMATCNFCTWRQSQPDQDASSDCATVATGADFGAPVLAADSRVHRASREPGAAAYFRGLVPAAAGVGGSCVAAGSDAAGGGGRSTPRVFVYMDPPYLRSSRSKARIYRHELTEAQHAELLRVANRLPCPCLIHGYPSPLYEAALPGWRTWTYRAMTRGGLRTEQCWANYPEPSELHDYSAVGANKRQRERIHRRCRNWSAALARAGSLERGAILQALAEQCQRTAAPDPSAGDGVGLRTRHANLLQSTG